MTKRPDAVPPTRCETFWGVHDQCALVTGHPGKHIFEDMSLLRPDAVPPKETELLIPSMKQADARFLSTVARLGVAAPPTDAAQPKAMEN